MKNFLDVDEEFLGKKLLLKEPSADAIASELFPGVEQKEPRILTPSQRKEASQCKFVIPNPGICVKTRDLGTNRKVFLNLTHAEEVPDPQIPYTDQELANILDSGTDNEVDDIRMPMSIGDLRKEVDKAGLPCLACDVIVNSEFLKTKLLSSEIYRTFFITVAMEGIDEKHKLNLDKNGYIILKNVKAFGQLVPQFLRSKAGIREVESSVVAKKPLKPMNGELHPGSPGRVEVVSSKTSLSITIIQVTPELAKAQAKLPLMNDHSKLEVKMGADRIVVTSPVGSLDVFVPLDIYQEKCRAEFNIDTSTLALTIPLVVKP